VCVCVCVFDKCLMRMSCVKVWVCVRFHCQLGGPCYQLQERQTH
jgi:hypothetical protein